jgi:aryl-phospho-beta-D-glucosidase BglC (GH1 family)
MSDFPITIPPGDSRTVTIAFTPTSGGVKTAQLRVISNAAGSPHTRPLVGEYEGPAAPLLRLHTEGTAIKNSEGDTVLLKSVNWHGAEGTNLIPHGLWTAAGRSYKSILNEIRGWGFNCIRLPFSGAWLTQGDDPAVSTAFDATLNPEFVGKTTLECIDLILDHCELIGLYVVLDHHRRSAGSGADGSPVGGGYTEANWQATWTMLATRWADRPCIAGADLHNEPHDLTWDDWLDLVEPCAEAIHAIAPDWLIFVEGVGTYEGDTYWWGGQLAGVADRQVSITATDKTVYSPHEYAHSVSLQSWLQYPGHAVTGWPTSLLAVWEAAWSFILTDGIAPIWIGEMGGWFGIDGSGNLTKPYATEEEQWLATLSDFLIEHGGSWCYWTYPPLSGDTGGLLEDDWSTPIQHKLDLLAPLLEADPPVPVPEGMYLTTSGNQLLDSAGNPVRLQSASWYGCEALEHCPAILWAINWEWGLQRIKDLGFNSLRFPFSGTLCSAPSTMPGGTAVNASLNPDLVGLTGRQIMRVFIDRCAELELRVILDFHSRTDATNLDGNPGTLSTHIANWMSMVAEYKDHPAVIGADVFNEPWTLSWADWRAYAQATANAVHVEAPHWLMFVQGVAGTGHWYGGNLEGVATDPVVLTVPNRLVYSPHEYGQSTNASQPWLKYASGAGPSDYPDNLWSYMDASWGYIFYDLNMPIWIGEYGGKFGLGDDGEPDPGDRPDGVQETQWLEVLMAFTGGDRDGDGGHDIPGDGVGMSMAWWSWNSDLLTNTFEDNLIVRALLDPMLGPYTPPPPEPGDPPDGWFVAQLPVGLTAFFTAETLEGDAGYSVHISGTVGGSSSANIWLHFGDEDVTPGQTAAVAMKTKVTSDDADLNDLALNMIEYNSSWGFVGGEYNNWWSGRLTKATRTTSKSISGTGHARAEMTTNNLSPGTVVDITIWMSYPASITVT